MERAIDPRHIFFFAGSGGRRYTRQVYWEDLYVFSYAERSVRVLVADRVAPHSSVHYALYETFKRGSDEPLLPRLLPEAVRGVPSPMSEAQSTDLIRSLSELLPDLPSAIPEDMFVEPDKELEEAASRALMRSGIPGGLASFSDPQEVQAIEERFADPTDPLHLLAGVEGKDTGLVNLSFHVDAALKVQIRESMEAVASEEALVRSSDVEFDVNRRLYSNPGYLAFVRRVMDAKGSYVSPVVRDFLSFYTRCLNIRLREHAEEEHVDPEALRKRVEGILGREKGAAHYALDYHELTILGYVREGDLYADPKDPDPTGQSFRVDSDVDPGRIAIQEVEDGLQRLLVRKFVEHTFNRHHNVGSVQYVDEAHVQREVMPSRLSRVVDALERRMQKYLLSVMPLEGWHRLGRKALFGAVGLLVAVFLVGAAMIAAFVMKVSR